MGLPAALQRAAFEGESEWAEDESFSSPDELPITGRVSLGDIERPLQDPNPTRRYMHGGVHHVQMPWSGTVQIEMLLTGLGSSAEGSISATPAMRLLGWALGNLDTDAEGSEVDTGWSSPTSGDLVGGSFKPGGLIRIGRNDPRDGRGNGQAVPVESFNGGTVETKVAFDGEPQSGDKAYAMGLVYPYESPPADSMKGKRFILATANQQYILRGCRPTALSISGLRDGELPTMTLTIAPSYVETTTGEFPGSSEPTYHAGTPVAGGSLVYNEVGDSDRQELVPRNTEVEIELEVSALRGPGGVWGGAQNIVGARRRRARLRLTTTLDAPAAGDDPWGDWAEMSPNDREHRYFLYTLSAADGRALALYLPRATLVERRPLQTEFEDLNRQRIQVEAQATDDGSSDLTRASYVLGIG